MSSGQIILYLLGSVIIIAGAYYATYFLAKKTGKMKSGGTIRLVESFSLSKDKSIYLVGVKDKAYLIALTGQNVTLLDKIDIAELETASVIQKGKPTSSQYKPQGVVQKMLWSAFMSIKNRSSNKSCDYEVSESEREISGEDKLDLVYNKMRNRLTVIDSEDRKYDEEKSK